MAEEKVIQNREDRGIGSLDEYQMASDLHSDEHIYPIYMDYMINFPGTKPYIGFEEWKQNIYPHLDIAIDSTLSRT
jgi:hypothetical protein